MIPQFNIDYLWKNVVNPRIGTAYQWGSFDCSMAVSQELEALLYGPAMTWARQFTTMTFIGAQPGEVGPFGGVDSTRALVCIVGPDAMPDAAMVIAVNQGSTPSTSHMICQVGGVNIEMGGSSNDYHTSKTDPSCADIHDAQFNQWFALPKDTVTDTLFADVSEFQVPVDDSYPYSVLSIRVCDGTYVDHNFAANYAKMRADLDSGKLVFGIVYTYVRPQIWASNATTVKQTIDANGGLHPRVALMLDVESGGNPGGDQSTAINALYNNLAAYADDPARIIGYGNVSDLDRLWPTKPPNVRLIVASYGSNPAYPGKIAHQYTDGQVNAGSLPTGAAPFGNCDMNSADGLDPDQFAAACGILATPTPPQPQPAPSTGVFMALTDQQQADMYNAVMAIAAVVADNNVQLRGPSQRGWPQLGTNSAGQDLTLVDAVADIKQAIQPVKETP